MVERMLPDAMDDTREFKLAVERVLLHRKYFDVQGFADTNDKLETSGFTLIARCEADDESSSWNKPALEAARTHRRKTGDRSSNEQVLVVESMRANEALNTESMHTLLEYISCNDYDRCVLFTGRKLTGGAEEQLQAYSNNAAFEVFKAPFINLPDHKLVPHHQLVKPGREEDAIFDRYKLARNQFPHILTKDPVTRYYGFPLHSMIEVTRQEDDDKLKIEYRVVCL